jgi:RimJ/RimL family protein N-acetyltransferase
MLRREFWGRGYAIEGARAAVQHAFTELDQPRIISLIRDGNDASVRVAQRLGETLEGRTEVMGREAMVYAMALQDVYLSLFHGAIGRRGTFPFWHIC